MKRLLNTLYILTPGTRLSREGGCILVEMPERDAVRVPMGTLEGVVCFAQVTHTPALLDHCAESGVTLTHLSEYGRFLARLEGPVSGNVLLRREQYRRLDDGKAVADLARFILVAKLANARRVLLRGAREEVGEEVGDPLRQAAERIKSIGERLGTVTELDVLRGLEGEAAALYWGVFRHLLKPREFAFTVRSRRPPLDPVNALLSFVYTLLLHDVRSALETVGLDPQAGYLHRLRPGRPSLALDVMEEFRAPVADRLVATLINREQVRPEGFRQEPNGAILMKDETRRTVLVAYQERKQEAVTHPFLDKKMPLGLLWHGQALLLGRYLRGELDGYPAYVWR
ncbi:MAG: type I-C CRISPR-associated endonuclease Cas1 [Magnetococcales bacterium]|nr:type I-C CRISPR-associated endonuclease Cas1 [Magnetococcales bacterium]